MSACQSHVSYPSRNKARRGLKWHLRRYRWRCDKCLMRRLFNFWRCGDHWHHGHSAWWTS